MLHYSRRLGHLIKNPEKLSLRLALLSTIALTTIAVAGAAIATGGSVAASTTAAKTASEKAVSTINQALKQLNKTGLRPWQTQISAKGVMNYVNNRKLLQGTGEIYRTGAQRFLVDGHHRMVAQTILRNGNFYTIPTNLMPSVTNIYWSKQWWEIGKVVIKVVK